MNRYLQCVVLKITEDSEIGKKRRSNNLRDGLFNYMYTSQIIYKVYVIQI